MKKRFLKVALLGAMAFTLPVSFYSCKDYDEDIQGLQQEDSEMQSQISALEKALESTKSELEAAKKSAADALKLAEESKAAAEAAAAKGDDALAAAEKAQAEALAAKALAEEAKAAAAQAKQEAIEEAVAQCKELMKDLASQEDVDALATEIAALSGKINGIEANLSTLEGKVTELDGKVDGALQQIADLNTWKATVDQQIKTLQAYEARIAELEQKLEGLDLKQMAADIETLKGNISALQEELAEKADKTEVADLKSELTALSNRVDEFLKEGGIFDQYKDQVAQEITSALNSVKNVLASRLTSLVFQPTLFVEGVPTIEIPSIQYTPMEWKENKLVAVTGAKTHYIDAQNTKLIYNMNPSSVTDEDIDLGGMTLTPAYAVTRTRAEVEQYVSIAGSEVVTTNGKSQLVVDVKKNNLTDNSLTGKINGDNIFLVALNVPIAEKNLTDAEKKGGGAWVSSEYTRVAETTGTIELKRKEFNAAMTEWTVEDLYDYKTIYASAQGANIIADVTYSTKDFDLNKYITSQYNNSTEMPIETLESYGIKLRYRVAEDEYLLGTGNANQQAFATVTEDGLLNAKNASGSTEDPVTAIGKEPIIWVEMYDAANQNNLIDRKYFKVRFVKEDLTPYETAFDYDKVELTCNDVRAKMNWEDFHKAILEKVSMSQEAFFEKYDTQNIEWTGLGFIDINSDAVEAGSDVIGWGLNARQIGEIPVVDGKAEKTFDGILTIPSKTGLEKAINVKLSVTIFVNIPTLVGYNSQAWIDNYSIYELLPISFESKGSYSTVVYDNDLISNGFRTTDNFLLKAFKDYTCRRWEFQFTNDGQPAGYMTKGNVTTPSVDNQAYVLVNSKNQAKASAELKYQVGTSIWQRYTSQPVNFRVYKDGGKELVGKDVQVGIWAKVNDYNTYEIKKFKVRILKPLEFSVTTPSGSFVDAKTDGSKVSIANKLKATEIRRGGDNIIGKSAMTAYYELSTTWDVANAQISMKDDNGTIVVDNSIKAGEGMLLTQALQNASLKVVGTDLVFTHGGGDLIHEQCNIFVPVKFTHKWGEEVIYVTIPLNPAK